MNIHPQSKALLREYANFLWNVRKPESKRAYEKVMLNIYLWELWHTVINTICSAITPTITKSYDQGNVDYTGTETFVMEPE